MKILVVVDMQNDFIDGSLGTKEAQAIVPNVEKKIAKYVKNGDIIIYTRDTHPDYYLNTMEGKKLPVKHCIGATKGWRIPDKLMPRADYDNHCVIDKFTFGAYYLPKNLREFCIDRGYELTDVTEIEVVGLCTDICVVSNTLLLKSYFYDLCDISVDATCCAGVTPETHEAALKTMEMCQINVKR